MWMILILWWELSVFGGAGRSGGWVSIHALGFPRAAMNFSTYCTVQDSTVLYVATGSRERR